MAAQKKQRKLQRQIVDAKIEKFSSSNGSRPASGWLKAVRESLGMTTLQLATRLGSSASSVTQLEERERKKTVTLETLERAANALGCDLVYSIVPRSAKSLEDLVHERALANAHETLRRAEHTMRLEAQGTSSETNDKAAERLAAELIFKGSSKIWDESTPKKGRSKS